MLYMKNPPSPALIEAARKASEEYFASLGIDAALNPMWEIKGTGATGSTWTRRRRAPNYAAAVEWAKSQRLDYHTVRLLGGGK